jgi:hypothetical protein
MRGGGRSSALIQSPAHETQASPQTSCPVPDAFYDESPCALTPASRAKRSGRSMPKLTPSVQKPETEFELDRGPMPPSPHPGHANGIWNQQVRSGRSAGNHRHLDASEAGKSDRLGTCWREIDDAALDVWSTIVDANDHGLAVTDVCHLHLRAEGQRTMSCRKCVCMGIFTIRSAFAAMD